MKAKEKFENIRRNQAKDLLYQLLEDSYPDTKHTTAYRTDYHHWRGVVVRGCYAEYTPPGEDVVRVYAPNYTELLLRVRDDIVRRKRARKAKKAPGETSSL